MKFINREKVLTKRLTLRPIEETDFDNLIDIFYSEEVKKTFMLPDFSSREEALNLARRFKDLSRDYNRFVYGVCLDNRLIGFVNDVFIGENEVELGYVISPSFKNNGYATETLNACIDLIFKSGFNVVKTGAFEENLASQRVMQKCGMALTGEEEQIEYRGKILSCKYYKIERVKTQGKMACNTKVMGFELKIVENKDLVRFKLDMQEAFQKGFEEEFGKTDEIILPEKDIDNSLLKEHAVAYNAVLDGNNVGGAIVVIDDKTGYNYLDLLFVKCGIQSKGIGKLIWDEIESRYPNTKTWETCTPYFERRNIHFYVNKCGFCITEFYNEKHPDPNMSEDFIGDGNEGMFVLKKGSITTRD